MKASLVLYFSLLVIASACVSATDNTLSNDQQPVVQAYLVPGQVASVQVAQQLVFAIDTTGSDQPIPNLALTISTNGKAYALRELGNGLYQATSDLAIKTGQTYQLDFVYNGKHVSGSTAIPTRPVSFSADQMTVYRTAISLGSGPGNGGFSGGLSQLNTPVHLTWRNPVGDYYFVVVDNIETDPTPIITRPTSTTQPAASARRFRSQPVQNDNTTIQSQSFQYFGRHRIVLYHLNPDYAALYKQSSTSTQNISTPPTTLTNGLGLFTGINTDTLYINVKPQ